MTTDNPNKQQSDNDILWDIVSDIVDQLQFATDTARSSVELIQKLLTVDQLPGISKEELSIVYCEYGTQDYRLIVDAGNEVDSTSSSSGIFDVTNSAIRNVAINPLKPAEYPWFKTKADCSNAGFDGFGTVMIVPMRLGRSRRLGVFIIHSKEEHAYSTRLQRVMDVLSDRLAALIRSLRRRLRDELTYKLRNELLARLASRQRMFEGECEILKQVLGHLKTWYEYDRIHILMKNPLDIETYYQAIDENGEVRTNFRAAQVLEQPALLQIMGGEDNLNRLKMPPSDSSQGMDALHGIIIADTAKLSDFIAECKSWLGVTMYHPDGYVFGHIILHDTEVPYAYDEDDLRFMEVIADFMGFLLAEYLSKQKKAVIQEIASLPLNKPEALYETVATYLRRLYGVEHFQIRAIESSSLEWKVVWPINENKNTLSRFLGNDAQNIIAEFANENRVRKNYGNEPLKLSIEKQNYLVTPMRAGTLEEDWRVIGAFVIPANNPGRIASYVIDEVADTLGNRLGNWQNQQRYQSLTEFVNTSTRLSPTDLTLERVLHIAQEHIRRVMFAENMYIALYDEADDSISFPLIYRNGRVWEEMHGQKRKIDPNRLGRTEVIIRDKKPLFIPTKADSLDWYAKPNHKEHAGNPVASWVGVPIFAASEGEGNEQKVHGVIAVCHEDLDFVYSMSDVFYLQNVAGTISNLLSITTHKASRDELAKSIESQKSAVEDLLRKSSLPVHEFSFDDLPSSFVSEKGDVSDVKSVSASPSKVIPDEFPESWATEWREDEYGLFMAFSYKNVRQGFRWLKPGTFLMGSLEGEPERYDNETLRKVTVTKGFWLTDTTITQAMWEAVMGENPSHFKGANRPVENVSWHDVQMFISKINSMKNELRLCLPTETQWEYACRAKAITSYAFGDELTREQANFSASETVNVASYSPNDWGLYDMHGNVHEWCQNQFGIETSSVIYGVLRGGSWVDSSKRCRAAFRNIHPLDDSGTTGIFGFRLARIC